MAFQQNNQFPSGNNQMGGAQKKKTNFSIRTIWGNDGRMDISIWTADTGPKVVLSVKQYVGKDLDKGTNIVEQKMPNELPNIYLNPRFVRGLWQFIEKADPSTISGALEWKRNDGSVDKSIIFGNENGKATITLTSANKGTRKMTFDTVSFGGNQFHSDWEEFKAAIGICLEKITTLKIDSYDELNPGNASTGDGIEE